MIEKAAYIKGLCDGLELDNSTKEGKVILALLVLSRRWLRPSTKCRPR